MQITIPKDAEAGLRAQAKASGFASVDDYVVSLLNVGQVQQPSPPLPYEDWRQELDEFLGSLTSSNPDFDDSRESIYPDR